MTHTLQPCQGREENSEQACVTFTMTAKGFNEQDPRETSEFLKILNKYQTNKIEDVDTSVLQAVFMNKNLVLQAVKELKEANLGISITVTGIVEHDYSVGIRGKLSKLPEDEILEITTMCGHGMVSQHLARKALLDMKRGIFTPLQAAQFLATPCICGVFNPKRAQRLLEELAEIWYFDEI